MIKNDLGIGFLSDVFAKDALDKKEIFEIRLDCEIPDRTICLVKDLSRPTSIATRELERLLLEPEPDASL